MQIINHVEIREGKAYIVGREYLKAEMVARMVIDGDYSIQETMQHYDLSASEVYAALAYYYDNQSQLDAMREKQAVRISQNVLDSTKKLEEIRSRKKADE